MLFKGKNIPGSLDEVLERTMIQYSKWVVMRLIKDQMTFKRDQLDKFLWFFNGNFHI